MRNNSVRTADTDATGMPFYDTSDNMANLDTTSSLSTPPPVNKKTICDEIGKINSQPNRTSIEYIFNERLRMLTASSSRYQLPEPETDAGLATRSWVPSQDERA